MSQFTIDFNRQFEEIYDGDNWISVNFCSAIDGVTPELAFQQPPGGRNTIAAIVKHMTRYKYFLLQKLQGNADYDVDQDETLDISDQQSDPKKGWRQLLEEQEEVHEDLLEALDDLEPEALEQIVGQRDYNLAYLINGVALHDIYHIGQIELLKKQLLTL